MRHNRDQEADFIFLPRISKWEDYNLVWITDGKYIIYVFKAEDHLKLTSDIKRRSFTRKAITPLLNTRRIATPEDRVFENADSDIDQHCKSAKYEMAKVTHVLRIHDHPLTDCVSQSVSLLSVIISPHLNSRWSHINSTMKSNSDSS